GPGPAPARAPAGLGPSFSFPFWGEGEPPNHPARLLRSSSGLVEVGQPRPPGSGLARVLSHAAQLLLCTRSPTANSPDGLVAPNAWNSNVFFGKWLTRALEDLYPGSVSNPPWSSF